jgi:transposase-like protein
MITINQAGGRRNHLGQRIGEWHGRVKWPDAKVTEARQLYGSLQSYRKVAAALGIPLGTVADWLRHDTRWDV